MYLECELDRIVDGFGVNSLIIGRVVAARVAEDSERVTKWTTRRWFTKHHCWPTCTRVALPWSGIACPSRSRPE